MTVDVLTFVLVLLGLGAIVWGVERMARKGDTWGGVLLLIVGAWCLAWPFW